MPNETMIRTVVHADLSGHDGAEDSAVFANAERYPLRRHDATTRAEARAAAPHLGAIPDAALTHFSSGLSLRNDSAVRIHLLHPTRGWDAPECEHAPGSVALFLPPRPGAAAEVHLTVDYRSTVRTLLFHHPDLVTHDPEVARIVVEHMEQNHTIASMIEEVAFLLRQMGAPRRDRGWARLVPFTPPANPRTGMTGTETRYEVHPTAEVRRAVAPIMTLLLKATKNDLRLEGKKWRVEPGRSVNVHSSPAPHALQALATVSTDTWVPALADDRRKHGLETSIELVDAAARRIRIKMKNYFIRFLGAYIRFHDANGKAISDAHWSPDSSGTDTTIVEELGIQSNELHYLGFLSPIANVFAIPIDDSPGELEATVTFPENAVRATIFGSGLGTGRNEHPMTPVVGGVLTGFVNLGIPGYLLAYQVAAATNRIFYGETVKIMEQSNLRRALLAAGMTYFVATAIEGHADFHALIGMSKLLFNEGATSLLLAVEEQIAAQKVLEAIPFAGWVLLALDIATGAAQIAQTIMEVSTSPWNIENQVATSITSKVTIHPDPRHLAFPQGENASYTVRLIYVSDSRPVSVFTANVPDSTPELLSAAFSKNTLGGKVRFEVDYKIDGWLAAHAASATLDNDEVQAAQVDLFLVQNPVPLSATTVYKHEAILQFDEGNYLWQPSKVAPTATVANRDLSPSGNAISEWTGLSLSQRHAMLGFAWKGAGMGIRACGSGAAGQLEAFLNVDIPGRVMRSVKFPDCGFTGPSALLYDPFPAKFLMENGQWVIGPDHNPTPDPNDVRLGEYYLDPRPASLPISDGGGIHLRRVTLDATTRFDLSEQHDRSYGRFAFAPDDTVAFGMHPAGFVIGVSSKNKKIHILPIADEPLPDDYAVVAFPFAGEALHADRRGLLYNPIAVACSYDGTVFVLEDLRGQATAHSARVQAFDLIGNPVHCFAENGAPSPFLRIGDASTTVLDLAAVGNEVTTYLYVLSYEGDGLDPSQYRVTVCCRGTQVPPQQPLLTVNGVASAKITVDMWHTMYALNYAMTTNAAGASHGPQSGDGTGPAGMTVPSVSEWIPKNG